VKEGETVDYQPDYVRVDHNQMHMNRRKEILQKHPEIKKLQGRYLGTFAYTLFCVGTLTLLTYLLKDMSYLVNVIAALTIGATIDHSLWVLIHDYTHESVFEGALMNKLGLLIADMTHVLPAAVPFRHYHRMHHGYLNETYSDPDMPALWEDRIFGHSAIGKALWLASFPITQPLRNLRYGPGVYLSPWWLINGVINGGYFLLLGYLWGISAMIFLGISTLFAVGLHPLGARWVAEHYSFHPKQETFSYYGPINWVAFNIGYHNEHHDFPRIPWNKLPEVKRVASEYYDGLLYHTSYLWIFYNFIFNPNFTLCSRVVRWPDSRIKNPADVELKEEIEE